MKLKLAHYPVGARAKVFNWGGDLKAALQPQKPIRFRFRINRINGVICSVDLVLFDHCLVVFW
jgi:hypothetical protein